MMGTFTKSFGSAGGYVAASKARPPNCFSTVCKPVRSKVEVLANQIKLRGCGLSVRRSSLRCVVVRQEACVLAVSQSCCGD